ncbi:ABC transporter ATP-binding protein [Dongia soli]|uniref:ABC transporter ATP-binding protein n=1 Tax=Dongia soli TaxID=600628 RepID=A0ABU5EAN4_9PROT|nr:ABC transporter ATP-binding protein [Dongia soli]MDY0883422.1 ABC transporter ATP-binding protein [Dongia soli]
MIFSDFRRRAVPFRNVLGFTFGYWRRQSRLAWAIAIAVIFSTLAEVLVPVYAGQLIDAITASDRASALDRAVRALGIMILLGAIMLILRHLAFMGIVRMTLRIMSEVAQEAFWRVQRFATDWHANTFAGSVVRKVTRGMWAIDQLDDTLLIAMLPSLVVLLGSTVLLGLHWPLMGAVVFIGSFGFVLLTAGLSIGYVGPAARISNAWDTRTGGALADAVSCNAVVKAFGAETREDDRLARVVTKWRRRTHRTWMRATNNGTAQLIALLVLRTAVIGVAIWLWLDGQATPGDVAYVLTTYFVVHGYLRDIGVHIRDLQRSVNDMEELVAIHGEPLGIIDLPDARPILIEDGRIEFDRVCFHYLGHEQPLYTDLSVTIAAGEKVGLVGLSGSGKTTFVKLIQRLHDINGGEIRIDGQNVASCAQASLRSQIAIVQQEPILFHRSLAENIAYARPKATMAEIEKAAKLANAHDFIMRLPGGYGTLVGERGVKLSGGERQRVALARAFLADAPILILDEATSSLDSESEAMIQEATERLIEGRTAIVIAHRLSTVRSLKRILIFERGRIIEEGDHRSLIQRPNGTYRRLFDRQVLGLVDA